MPHTTRTTAMMEKPDVTQERMGITAPCQTSSVSHRPAPKRYTVRKAAELLWAGSCTLEGEVDVYVYVLGG